MGRKTHVLLTSVYRRRHVKARSDLSLTSSKGEREGERKRRMRETGYKRERRKTESVRERERRERAQEKGDNKKEKRNTKQERMTHSDSTLPEHSIRF